MKENTNMKERKWNGLYISIVNECEVYEDVGVYVSDEELDDALNNGEIAEYIAYKVAKNYIRYWNEQEPYTKDLLPNLLESLDEEDVYGNYADEIEAALEKIAEGKKNPIDAEELAEMLVEYTEVYDEGEWEFDEDEDSTECPYEMGLYWDGGLVL